MSDTNEKEDTKKKQTIGASKEYKYHIVYLYHVEPSSSEKAVHEHMQKRNTRFFCAG